MKKVIMLSSAMLMVLLLASCGIQKSTDTSTDAAPTTSDVIVLDESMEKTADETVDADAMMETDKMEDEDSMEKIETMTDEKEDSEILKEEVMIDKEDEAMEKTEIMTKELAGTYADYDASMVGSTENTVIFFHANWCPSCRAADAGISGGTIPDGLTILKADFDSKTDLRKKYSVVGQHTFVQVDADGNEIKKWLGGNSIDEVVERLQ